MLASRPFFKSTPCSALLKSMLFYPSIIDLTNELQGHQDVTHDQWTSLHGSMHEMRNLSDQIAKHNARLPSTTPIRISAIDIMGFSKTRTSIEHQLLSLLPLSRPVRNSIDCLFEACRLGSLIFINCVLREFSPKIGVLKILKSQLIGLIQEAECNSVDPNAKLQLPRLTWAFIMGGIVCVNDVEETWFAQRIARTMTTSGLETWGEVEELLFKIGWAKKLNNWACKSLWRRVDEIRARGLAIRIPCPFPSASL